MQVPPGCQCLVWDPRLLNKQINFGLSEEPLEFFSTGQSRAATKRERKSLAV